MNGQTTMIGLTCRLAFTASALALALVTLPGCNSAESSALAESNAELSVAVVEAHAQLNDLQAIRDGLEVELAEANIKVKEQRRQLEQLQSEHQETQRAFLELQSNAHQLLDYVIEMEGVLYTQQGAPERWAALRPGYTELEVQRVLGVNYAWRAWSLAYTSGSMTRRNQGLGMVDIIRASERTAQFQDATHSLTETQRETLQGRLIRREHMDLSIVLNWFSSPSYVPEHDGWALYMDGKLVSWKSPFFPAADRP